MGKEKGKQSKLEKIKSFKAGCISQGKGFRALKLEFSQAVARLILLSVCLIGMLNADWKRRQRLFC